MMPKSKNNRKGKSRDRRPVPRSGRNEGPADYRTAQPADSVHAARVQLSAPAGGGGVVVPLASLGVIESGGGKPA